jgi:hypothetical protein
LEALTFYRKCRRSLQLSYREHSATSISSVSYRDLFNCFNFNSRSIRSS